MMDKQLYERAKEFENIFRNAIKMDFLRVTPDVMTVILEIHGEVFGKPLTKSQRQCNSCKLKAIKELGKLYFEEKDKEVEETPKVKKRGRPRKIDLDELEQ